MTSPFAWKGTASETGAGLDRAHLAQTISARNTDKLRKQGKNLSPVPSLSKTPHGGAYSRALVTAEQARDVDETAGLV